MNRNLYTLAVAILALGLGGTAVAGDHNENRVQTTAGADSATTQNSNRHHGFNELDSNKDGKLSHSELEASDKKGKWADKWSSMDSNQDGLIDQSEYNRFKSTYKHNQDTGSTIRDGNTTNSQGTHQGDNRTNQR